MNCPYCDSNNVRKFSLVYEDGTSRGKSEGFSDNAHYESEHFSQTPLAKRCSPPEAPEPSAIFFLISFLVSVYAAFKGGFFMGGFWWGVGVFVSSLVILIFLWGVLLGKSKKNRYDSEYMKWEKSWVCLKCGKDFQID